MSGNATRSKPKQTSSRGRNRGNMNSFDKFSSSPNSAQPRDDIIYSNQNLTHVFCQTVMGNTVEIYTTENQVISGVFRAVSPSGDICVSQATVSERGNGSLNGVTFKENVKVELKDIKRMVVPDSKPEECVKHVIQTDAEIARRGKQVGEHSLQSYFNEAEPLEEDCLEMAKDGDHWFDPVDMFRVNRENFDVQSTFKDDLTGYTVAIDKNAHDYHERNARASRLANEMERNPQSRKAAQLENEDADEEAQFSSVSRPTGATNSTGHRQPDQRRSQHPPLKENQRARALLPTDRDTRGGGGRSGPRYRNDNGDVGKGSSLSKGANSDGRRWSPPVGNSNASSNRESVTPPIVGNLKSSREASPIVLEETVVAVAEGRVEAPPPISDMQKAFTEVSVVEEAMSMEGAVGRDAKRTTTTTTLNPDAPEFKPRALPPQPAPSLPVSRPVGNGSMMGQMGNMSNMSAASVHTQGNVPPLVPPGAHTMQQQQQNRYPPTHGIPQMMFPGTQNQFVHPGNPQALMVAQQQMRANAPQGNGKPNRAVVNVNQAGQNQGQGQMQPPQPGQQMPSQQPQQHPPALSSPHQQANLLLRQRSHEAAFAGQPYIYQFPQGTLSYQQPGMFQPSYPAQGMPNRSTPPGQTGAPPHLAGQQHQGQPPTPVSTPQMFNQAQGHSQHHQNMVLSQTAAGFTAPGILMPSGQPNGQYYFPPSASQQHSMMYPHHPSVTVAGLPVGSQNQHAAAQQLAAHNQQQQQQGQHAQQQSFYIQQGQPHVVVSSAGPFVQHVIRPGHNSGQVPSAQATAQGHQSFQQHQIQGAAQQQFFYPYQYQR